MLFRCSILFLFLLAIPSFGQERPSARVLLRKFDANDDKKLDLTELKKALRSLDGKQQDSHDKEQFKFIRVQRDRRGKPKSLDTSTAKYVGKGGLEVDLISAVHVADKRYFTDLNKQFKDYDVVLYELVAPEGTRIPKGGSRPRHALGHMQEALKSMLDLSFQLNHIDYGKSNLVHADMTPEEFSKSMKDRGESFIKILFRMMGQAAAQGSQNNGSDVELIMAFFSSKRSLRLKQAMANQFENLEGQMSLFEGPNGSTLISGRNQKAMSVLSREIKKGKKRIAIFYGAGHMPDMSKRLKTKFGLAPKSEDWTVAWDMSS